MTPEQRLFDFQALTSLYAKRYAPATWKQQALGVNIFELQPWAARVRAAKSDIEYYETASKFVASFRDGHTRFQTPSQFVADLGLFVDIFDGKVLIEQIVRSRLPLATFPFVIGDELVSLDGVPVEDIITELASQQSFSNPRTTRRASADAITFRPQSRYPRAAELPEESQIVVRRASGDLESYRVPWLKTGSPFVSVGPVPSPFFARPATGRAALGGGDPLGVLQDLRTWAVPQEMLLAGQRWFEDENGEPVERKYVTGWGAKAPHFTLPSTFQQRLGRLSSDAFYSGVYLSGQNRIGYLRINNFAPSGGTASVLAALDTEIAHFRANTDGLVVDVTRNTGGGCIGLDYAARLHPRSSGFSANSCALRKASS